MSSWLFCSLLILEESSIPQFVRIHETQATRITALALRRRKDRKGSVAYAKVGSWRRKEGKGICRAARLGSQAVGMEAGMNAVGIWSA